MLNKQYQTLYSLAIILLNVSLQNALSHKMICFLVIGTFFFYPINQTSQLFRIFTEYHQSDDNFQEYIYNQVVKVRDTLVFVNQAIEMYYKSLSYYTSFVTEGNSIVDCIVCKWEEMQYIKQVINVVLLYVVFILFSI